METSDKFHHALKRLKEYCELEDFKGYDPYDGLNSTLFQSLKPISNNRIARLIWIQAFKRSPFNLRKITGVKKEYNAKALGLFLSGYCNLYKTAPSQEYLDKISFLSAKILQLQNKDFSGACWGYNFDWQARAFFQPKNTPTVVASTFIASALLDAYEITKDDLYLQTARSTCDFILNDLNKTYDDKGNFAFSYSPLDKSVVFNASLLGSRILSRVYSFTNEKALIDGASKSVAFCCNHQNEDGTWGYGTYDFHQWIDNFHTGYNLECIADYSKHSGDESFQKNITKGLKYYLTNFFTAEGIPKYYNTSVYPIDIHAPAQLVITLTKLGKFKDDKDLIDRVLNWTIDNMQSKEGYFYYQINKYFSSTISYMRWAQAWMFYALSSYILYNKSNE